ncbi:MAG TPA: RES domain-containing protein [Nitrospirae bacterium]|nr:RES domain-containing protein [Nitrospirota bacterium]
MATHPDYEVLRRRIEACGNLGQSFRGHVYRCSALEYAVEHKLVSGEGSKINGGRWNAPGSFRAVYTGQAPDTALKEAQAQARYYGLERYTIFPLFFVALNVSLHNVLDLTLGSLRQHLIVSQRRMLKTDWRSEQDNGREALTQAIGRAVFSAGFEGLLAPSVADPSGKILVFFPVKLKKSSTIQYILTRPS